jgi:general secretion pathway protein A
MDENRELLSFFGLREQPFAPTADPAYFFATREHKECLFRLWSSIDQRHGIAVVLGNYGTGKTTLLRKLLTGMAADPARYRTAVIGSPIPSWTSFALLEAIAAQFGLQPEAHAFGAYMEALNQHLLQQRGRICTLIIDDAQNLNKRGQLELLRLVQNLETQQHKLLNLVCFAQLEWKQVLRAAPNFAQRVNVTYSLPPIGEDETRQFIEFRIGQAMEDSARRPLFSDMAYSLIHRYSGGSPRLIVSLCRNTLLVAARLRQRAIDQALILNTIAKTTLTEQDKLEELQRFASGLPPRAAAPVQRAAVPAPRPVAAPRPPVTPAISPALLDNTPLGPAPAERGASLFRTQPPAPPAERMSRDQRAAEMLLKALQDKGQAG